MKIIRYSYIFLLLLSPYLYSATYWGAEYRTKEAFVYGRFEARYKPPRGSGTLASFFTYHEITSTSQWNEIDFEILGRYSNDVQVTSIGPGQKVRNSHQFVPFIPQDDFHTYAFEWTPDYIAWFIDEQEVYRQDQAHIQQFVHPQKIMMNIWSPEWAPWSGAWDDRILPIFAYYDWVSYASFTPDSGNTGSDNNFTREWKDEFDHWDQDRWAKATHTFGGNRVTFKPDNVIFKDGCMVLCLTKDPFTGYTDKTVPSILWARVLDDTVTVHFSEDVTQLSAESKTNYYISGINILQAHLQSDRRTVKLAVSGMDPEKDYTLVALGIKDTWTPANTLTGQAESIVRAKPLQLPVKINVGGKAWCDYLPDQEWGPDVEYGHSDGYEGKCPPTIDVLNTDEDSLYYSELHELVTYRVRLPYGRYKVTLKMAEMYFTDPEKRYFDIFIEGVQAAEHLDLAQQPGPKTALEVVLDDVLVTDGILEIHFDNLWDFTLLNGLVVETSSVDVTMHRQNGKPEQWLLLQNYPNPFNASTTIYYQIPVTGWVDIRVYDQLGRQVDQLVDQVVLAGEQRIQWKPDLPSGIYYIQIRTNTTRAVHKILLIR